MRKALFFLSLFFVSFPAHAAEKESAFDKIVASGVIRCGYYVFPPMVMRDPNTDKLSGLSIDYMEKLAARASLKVKWTQEITWSNWVPELQAKRFDVVCTPIWPDMAQLKAVNFTDPMFFAGLYPLVRKDDARFAKGGFDRINQPDVTVLTQEGNMNDSLARAVLPKAKFYTLPPSASGGEFFQSLIAKKADVMLTDRNGLAFYEKNNSKNFKFIGDDKPIKLQTFPMALARGEFELRDFLNQSIKEMQYDGETDRLLRKWEPEPGKTFLRVGPPQEATK